MTPTGVFEAIKRSPAICILIVLAVAGYIYHQAMDSQVFPTASLDLKYSSAQILARAKELSKKYGYSRPNLITSIKFDADENAKTFLERQYGQAEANRLMEHTLPVWVWDIRLMKERESEQAEMQLNPAGQLLHFQHALENDRCLPSLDNAKARQLGLDFVQNEVGIPLSKWELITSKDKSEINRVDHTFEWQETFADYKGAHRRVAVEVCGDIIGLFDLSLHTPESWDRDYETIRSGNKILSTVAFAVFIGISLGAFFLFVRALATKACSLKAAISVGAVFGLAILITSLNGYPSWAAEYNPEASYNTFLLKQMGNFLFNAAAGGLLIALLFVAVQPAYKNLCADRIPLQKWLSPKILRSSQLIEAIVVGYAVCGLSQGYQIVYYFLGERVGYWCPMQVTQYQTFSDMFPFVDAMGIGVMAALMEEGLYRVVALYLFQKLFRGNFWIANLLQAAAWGFMHSDYPQQPAYARGVELTVQGVLDGWILKRYGLMPSLLWHYLFDALCGVQPLSAAPPAIAWTWIIPIILPALLLVCSLVASARSGFVDDAEITRESSSEHEKHKDAEPAKPSICHLPSFAYTTALSHGKRTAICVLAIVALAVTVFCQSPQIGTGTPPLNCTRAQAVDVARTYFRESKIDLEGYIVADTELKPGVVDQQQITYMNEKLGFARAREILQAVETPLKWFVRFSKPKCADEYYAMIDQNGKMLAPGIVHEESAAGANLTTLEARTLAEEFVKRYRPAYNPCEFMDEEKKVLAHRTDYEFTFVVPRYQAAEAKLTVTVGVSGNQVSSMRHRWLLPDKWTWNYSLKNRELSTAVSAAQPVLIAVGLVLLLWSLIEQLMKGSIRWKWPCILAGISLAVQLAQWGLMSSTFLKDYSTTTPLDNYVAQYILQTCVAFISLSFCALILGALAGGALSRWYQASYVSSALQLAFKRQPSELRSQQSAMWLDAVLVIAAYAALVSLLTVGLQFLQVKFDHEPAFVSLPGALQFAASSYLPLAALMESTRGMILGVSMLLVIPFLMQRFLKGNPVFCGLLMLVVVLVFDTDTRFASDFIMAALPQLISVLLLWFVVLRSARSNLLIPFVWGWALLIPAIVTLRLYGLPLLTAEFCSLLVLLFAPLAYLAYMQLAPAPVPAVATVPANTE